MNTEFKRYVMYGFLALLLAVLWIFAVQWQDLAAKLKAVQKEARFEWSAGDSARTEVTRLLALCDQNKFLNEDGNKPLTKARCETSVEIRLGRSIRGELQSLQEVDDIAARPAIAASPLPIRWVFEKML